MTAPSLLDELASEEKWLRQAAGEIASEGHNGWGNTCSQAADCIKRTHAALADMANELRVARESFKRCDEICKCMAEGWRTAEEDMAKRLEAAERDARVTRKSAETLCRIYFEIAAEAVGEDQVRAERDRRIHAAQEGE